MEGFTLTDNDRIVSIKIRVSSEGRIPAAALRVDLSSVETERDLAYSSQNSANGVNIVPSVPCVEASNLVDGLLSKNYILTNLIRRRVQNGWRGHSPVWVWTLQYNFTLKHVAVPKDAVKNNQEEHLKELKMLLSDSYWPTMVHRNPFVTGGKTVPGTNTVIFSLTAPEPKYDENGKFQRRWVNKADKTLGKVPFMPKFVLRVRPNGNVDFVSILQSSLTHLGIGLDREEAASAE